MQLISDIKRKIFYNFPPNYYLHLFLLSLLACIAYSNSFSGQFIFDDLPAIVENRMIRSLPPLSDLLFQNAGPLQGRPFPALSFILNFHFGELNVFGYHLFNLLIHIACGVLIYGIVFQFCQLKKVSGDFKNSANLIAFAIASIWIVHPLTTGSVCYVTQRTGSMMSLAYLGTFYCTLRSLNSEKKLKWMILASFVCLLGVGCKETIVTAPFVCGLLVFFASEKNFTDKVKTYAPLFLGLMLTWVGIALVRVFTPRAGTVGFSIGISPFFYLVNQIHVICAYLRLSLIPYPLNLDYGVPVPYNIAETILPLIILLSFFAFPFIIWKKNIFISYLVFCFFIILSPTSSFVPILLEVGAERRMYLPLLPLIALGVIGFLMIKKRFQLSKKFSQTVFLLIIFSFTSITILRTADYNNPARIWESAKRRLPTNKRAWLNTGHALMEQGKLEQAAMNFKHVLKLDPNNKNALTNLCGLENRKGNYKQALEYVKDFLAPEENMMVLNMNIGKAYAGLNDMKACTYFKHVLKNYPSFYAPAFHLGNFEYRKKNFKEAIKYYKIALKNSQNDANKIKLNMNIGTAYACLNDKEAINYYQNVLKLSPANFDAEFRLGIFYMKIKDYKNTEKSFQNALKLSGRIPPVLAGVGEFYCRIGKTEEGIKYLREAHKKSPKNNKISNLLNKYTLNTKN